MASILPGMEPKDVSDFHFRQLTRYQLQNDEDQITNFPRTPLQRLALTNKLGIVFAACKNSLVSVKVSELEKNDELASNVKTSSLTANKIVKSISSDESSSTQLPATASHLGINADETILAVAVILPSTGKPHIYMYDTRSFSTSSPKKPFMEIPPATPPGIVIVELAWNPVVPSMLAVVFSDGSLALHMINDQGFDTATLPPAEKICCVAWSPKGKQLVAGKSDGVLTQYKPDLKVAKTIPKPVDPSNPEQVLSACSILWASTYQFLVLFKNTSNQASLYLVQSSKAGDTKHFNYDDICYSTGDSRDPYFMMYHQMDWPLIFCASANGIEVALMGNSGAADAASWQQWNLEDAGRAELPLVSNTNDERYPVGMVFCTGGVNRCLPIDDAGNCMPHPVPILFMLAPDGLLCGFYALNKGAARITKQLENVNGTMRPGVIDLPTVPPNPSGGISFKEQPLTGGGAKLNLHEKFQAVEEETTIKSSLSENATKPSSNIGFSTFGLQPTLPGKPVIASTPIKSAGFSEPPKSLSNSGTQHPKIEPKTFLTPNPTTTPIRPSIGTVETQAEKSKPATSNQNASDKCPQSEARYQALIREEIIAFEKELNEFKSRASNISIDVGTNDEKAQLKKGLVDMDGFRKLLIETTSSQCREISQIKKYSLENCQWLEEAKSRQTRNKDPRYLQLLKGRSLDPHSQKQLAKVQSKFMYLDQQIDEINNKLDLEWENHCRKTNFQVTGRGNARRLQNEAAPSLETIYKVLHNHHGIIEKHKNECENLAKNIKELNLQNIGSSLQLNKRSAGRKSARIVHNDELAKLADSLMEKTLLNDSNKTIRETKPSLSGKAGALSPIVGFSPEKESQLRKLLAEKGTTKIVPKQTKFEISTNSTVGKPEKASKNLLSSLDKYKDVTVVLESPKSTAIISTLENTDKLTSDQKGSIKDGQPHASLSFTKPIFNSSAITSSPAITVPSGFGFRNSSPTIPIAETKKIIEPEISKSSIISDKPSSFSFMGGKPLQSSNSIQLPMPDTQSQFSFNSQIKANTPPSLVSGSKQDNDVSSSKSLFNLPKVTTSMPVPVSLPDSTTKSNISSTFHNIPSTPFSFGSTATPNVTQIGASLDTLDVTKSQEVIKKENVNQAASVTGTPSSTIAPSDSKSLASNSLSFQATTITTSSDTDAKYTSTLNKLAVVKPVESPKATQVTSSLFSGAKVSSQSLQDKLMGSNVTTNQNTSIFKNDLQNAQKSSAGIFGTSTTSNPPLTSQEKTSTPLFGATTTTSSNSIFGGVTTASKNLFGTTSNVTTTPSSGIFGGNSTKSTSIFGGGNISIDKAQKPTAEITSSNSSTSIFGGASFENTKSETITTKTNVASAGIFGGSSFQTTTPTKPANSSAPTSGSIFGASTFQNVTSASGTESTTSTSVFGGSTSKTVPIVTTGASTTSSNSIFGGSSFKSAPSVSTTSSSTASSTSIFGGSSLKSSDNSSTSNSTSIFGGNTENKPTTTASGGSIFGGSGGFFSGLGSNPSSDAASKNVFGGSSGSGSGIFGGGGTSNSLFGSSTAVTTANTSSIFGGGNTSTPFGAPKTTTAFGSFTSGGSNVSSQGFGISQAASTPAKTGIHSFGSAPKFGGSPTGSTTAAAPAFGGGPAFGSAPAFGGATSFGTAPVFGGSTSSTFGAMGASNNAPTFGSLGGQNAGGNTFGSLNTNTPTFGSSSSQPGFGGFSSPNNAQPASNLFGSSGGAQSPGGAPSPGGASFNSWR